KKTLIEHGFRLPSAADNRPLKFNEFMERVGQIIYTSATPSDFERERSAQIVEQIIRPTGLVDPEIEVRGVMARTLLKDTQGLSLVTTQPYPGQIKDFITEAEKVIKGGTRVIATTLTKKMTEDLSTYLKEKGIKAEYLHSEIKTIERIKILTDFRKGKFDCLVGVNLLREGLDLPEVSLIGILDADKEGFLRSEVSLIQTIGRAARNAEGRVILYGDNITGSMKRAIDETNRRREIQLAYNKKNHITPKTIIKNISDITQTLEGERGKALFEIVKIDKASGTDKRKLICDRQKQMTIAIKELDFETAALLRDEIKMLKGEM
ncbi:MAG: helicase-related protein, partial [Patescibacteria group bacterium]